MVPTAVKSQSQSHGSRARSWVAPKVTRLLAGRAEAFLGTTFDGSDHS
jgi:hypothetical protein